MPWKWDRYEDEGDERKCTKYMVGGCHDSPRGKEDNLI
jgi:hypothetical protein